MASAIHAHVRPEPMALGKIILLNVLIMLAVLPLAIASGRAKGERLRQLRRDFEARKPGALIIAGGVALYLLPLFALPIMAMFR